jgi:SAM-dependent methyltransferase
VTDRRFAKTTQAEAWNGRDGLHWADHHDRYDAMAEEFNTHLFAAAALTETSRVLDIGCGTGRTTRVAARRARRGRVLGIDVSAPMLERARHLTAAEGVTNADFVLDDAQIHRFHTASFDVALSRAGVMFFADPVTAFANIGGALEPDGRLVFLTHSHVSKRFRAIYETLAEHLPVASQTTRVASFADPGYVERVLTGAGFTGVTASRVEILSTLGRDVADAVDFLFGGPLRPVLAGADESRMARARTAVSRVLRSDERDGAVRLPAHAWLCTARNVWDPRVRERNGGRQQPR